MSGGSGSSASGSSIPAARRSAPPLEEAVPGRLRRLELGSLERPERHLGVYLDHPWILGVNRNLADLGEECEELARDNRGFGEGSRAKGVLRRGWEDAPPPPADEAAGQPVGLPRTCSDRDVDAEHRHVGELLEHAAEAGAERDALEAPVD